MKKTKLTKNLFLKGISLAIGTAGALYGGYLAKKTLEKNGISVKIKSIVAELATSNTAIINFRDIIKEPWDTMLIFPSYTSNDDIFDALGFVWDDVYKTSISYNNEIVLLVFMSDTKVVKYIEYPKIYGDFSKLEKDFYNDGIFELSKRNDKIVIKESYD